MGLLNRKKCAIGLDIGSSSVKLMELDHDAKAGAYRLVSFGIEPLPPEAIVDGSVMNTGAVVDAIRIGYRHLDCACDYGNEEQVGEGIRRALEEGLVASRSDLWVTSKLWNT